MEINIVKDLMHSPHPHHPPKKKKKNATVGDCNVWN